MHVVHGSLCIRTRFDDLGEIDEEDDKRNEKKNNSIECCYVEKAVATGLVEFCCI